MPIPRSVQKIAIIGKGTAGSLSLAHFLRQTNFEIEWYFDEQIKPQAVGEGSNLVLPKVLFENLNLSYKDIFDIDGTIKIGLKKQNWGNNPEFYHLFSLGNTGIHFNAVKLQKLIYDKVHKHKRLKIINKNINNYDGIDADYIIDCSGAPKDIENFYRTESIPVNSVHVVQCSWEKPEFFWTLTLARPHGWVFGIPLKNRCSIGYLYNNNISSLEDVKTDIMKVIEENHLTPSEQTNTFNFKNYYRLKNFTDRVAFNGNASFFLEPLEASSLAFVDFINKTAFEIIHQLCDIKTANTNYSTTIKGIEQMIMLHYYAGSMFKTPFWEFAKERGINFINKSLEESLIFKDILKLSKKCEEGVSLYGPDYGTWSLASYYYNLKEMGIYEKIVNSL